MYNILNEWEMNEWWHMSEKKMSSLKAFINWK